jgi:hypothetical protein
LKSINFNYISTFARKGLIPSQGKGRSEAAVLLSFLKRGSAILERELASLMLLIYVCIVYKVKQNESIVQKL